MVVVPAAVEGGAGEFGKLVEGGVAIGDFGADGPVDGFGDLAAVFFFGVPFRP